MSKVWRGVFFAVLALLAAGVVLMGAGWLTGGSIPRIVELVFGGPAELQAWLQSGLDRMTALWTGAVNWVTGLF